MTDLVFDLNETAEIKEAEGDRMTANLCKNASIRIEYLQNKLEDLESDATRLNSIVQAQAEEMGRLRAALRAISAKKYESRDTVSEANAWQHFQTLNAEVVAIFDIADEALAKAGAA